MLFSTKTNMENTHTLHQISKQSYFKQNFPLHPYVEHHTYTTYKNFLDSIVILLAKMRIKPGIILNWFPFPI